MSDIVEQLRAGLTSNHDTGIESLMWEAADEIERLQRSNDLLYGLLQEVYDGRQSSMPVGLTYRIGHTLNHGTSGLGRNSVLTVTMADDVTRLLDKVDTAWDDLRGENAALRKDAERYREWRRAFRDGECGLYNALCDAGSEAEHDAAIDAALQERKS